jgi:uncharacterized protein YciI
MFVVLLKFAHNRAQAGQHMEAHKAWLQRGFDDGVFLVAGSLAGGAGGSIVAHGTTLEDLHERIGADPFVAEGVVAPEVIALTPSRADPRLAFLLA